MNRILDTDTTVMLCVRCFSGSMWGNTGGIKHVKTGSTVWYPPHI